MIKVKFGLVKMVSWLNTPVKSNCPLCQSIANVYRSYPGTFLSCNELLQCQNCDLIFADKLPSKNELDEYYSTGLYYDKVSDPYNPEFLYFSLKKIPFQTWSRKKDKTALSEKLKAFFKNANIIILDQQFNSIKISS